MPLLAQNTNPRPGLGIADLARVVVGVVGFIYAVGFLVVTFHLAAFGVAPVTWLRPQYLLAGIWCLLPPVWVVCGLAIIATGVLEPWVRVSTEVPQRTRRARYVMGGVQGLLLGFCVFAFLSFAVDSVVSPSSIAHPKLWTPGSVIAMRLCFLCLLSTAGMLCGVFLVYGAMKPIRKDQRIDQQIMAISVGIFALVFTLQIAITYVRYFSAAVYSAIPLTYGGGRPQSVVFLIDRADQRSSPIIPDSSGTRSIPYNLVLVTESNYVVESPSKSELAIEFKQDSVHGLIVLR